MYTIVLGNQFYVFPNENELEAFVAMLFKYALDRRTLYMELVGNGGAYYFESQDDQSEKTQDARESTHRGLVYLHANYGKVYDPEEEYLDLSHRVA